MALTQADKKYWAPVRPVMDYIASAVIKPDDRVLEVGPGHSPFKRANVAVDFVDVPGLSIPLHKCDLGSEPLPFEDKSFDFVFCRHTLEDMYNPFNLVKEMSRVGKAGYIETPSPIAELGRGVDGGSPPFYGYHHHRWIVWTFGKELRFVSKYAFVEYLRFNETVVDDLLKQERYWNTYHLWEGEIVCNHIQSPLNFNIPRDYAVVLNEAIERSREAADIFFSNMTK